jgi:hypothetical protein
MAGNFSVTVEVPNLLAVQARLEELGVVKVPIAMRKIIVAGAKPMKAAIQNETPIGEYTNVKENNWPGDLQRGVRYKSGKTSKALASIAGAHQSLAYYMVGPMGKGTAHRHLVIGGHEIVGHKPNLTHTGKRTTPNPFVERGRKAGEGPAIAAIEVAAKAALEAAARS